MKKMTTLVLVLLMLLTLPVHAAGNVKYNGDANKFFFAPGTADSPTSLFEDFQDVMPGDVITEQIVIKNATSNNVKVRLYLRSLGAQEDTQELLSQLNLTVKKNEDTVYFDAPPSQTAQLTDWVYLGTMYSGGTITLDVTLKVPITLDNRYQNSIGYFDWEFMAEELPIEPTDPPPPQTGDGSNIHLLLWVMLLSLAALVVLIHFGRRKKETA